MLLCLSFADAEQGIDITNEKEPSSKKLPSQLVSKEKGGLLLEEKNKTAAGSATIMSVLSSWLDFLIWLMGVRV